MDSANYKGGVGVFTDALSFDVGSDGPPIVEKDDAVLKDPD